MSLWIRAYILKKPFLETTFSYRLELMRQIYNTAESPEMAIFQLMDMTPSAGGGEATPTPVNPQPKVDAAQGHSSCKNTSRLSLANLLPSRLEHDLNFNLIVEALVGCANSDRKYFEEKIKNLFRRLHQKLKDATHERRHHYYFRTLPIFSSYFSIPL